MADKEEEKPEPKPESEPKTEAKLKPPNPYEVFLKHLEKDTKKNRNG
jgi:hypothetical protein